MIFSAPSTAYVVEKAVLELYDGVPSASPLTISATPPTVAYRCRVTVTSATGHTDCAGSITIAGEAITFATSGQKKIGTVTIAANTKPTITYSGLDCNILIECLDVAGQEIKVETTTAIKVRCEPEMVTIRNPDGSFTIYNGYFMTRDATTDLGSIIRYNSTDYTLKRIEPLSWVDGTESYRILYF
jgi:hypothetical protein